MRGTNRRRTVAIAAVEVARQSGDMATDLASLEAQINSIWERAVNHPFLNQEDPRFRMTPLRAEGRWFRQLVPDGHRAVFENKRWKVVRWEHPVVEVECAWVEEHPIPPTPAKKVPCGGCGEAVWLSDRLAEELAELHPDSPATPVCTICAQVMGGGSLDNPVETVTHISPGQKRGEFRLPPPYDGQTRH